MMKPRTLLSNYFPAVLMIPLTLLLAAVATPCSATVIVTYNADATPTAQNPTAQGWALRNSIGTGDPFAGQEMIEEISYNYWSISNPPPADESWARTYYSTLNGTDFSDLEGWTATAVLRVVSSPDTRYGSFIEVRDGSRAWEINFQNNAGGTSINYHKASAPSGNVSLSNFNVGADYFTVQMYYNPALSALQVFLNGEQIGGSILPADVMPDSNLWIRWGDLHSGGGTPRTSTHWNFIQFETGYAVIPEPTSLMLILGALAVFLWRQRIRA